MLEEVSQIWVNCFSAGDFKSFDLLLALPHTSLRSILWDEKGLNPELDTQNIRISEVKIRDNFLSFSVIQTLFQHLLHNIPKVFSTTTPESSQHHQQHSEHISQLPVPIDLRYFVIALDSSGTLFPESSVAN